MYNIQYNKMRYTVKLYFKTSHISYLSKITRSVINLYVRRLELCNEACRKLIASFARRRRIYGAAFMRFRRKSIRKAWISAEDALSNRAKNTGIVVSPPGDTSKLWSREMGTRYTVERWECNKVFRYRV